MLKAADLGAIRAIITRAKRWDLFFAVLGLLSLMVGVLTFTVLFLDMAIQGVPRLSLDFFTNFPSRRAENAGISRLHRTKLPLDLLGIDPDTVLAN